jgi:hypothetical protein
MAITDYYDQTIKVITVTAPAAFTTNAFSESCSTATAYVNPSNGIESFTGGRNEPFADYKAFMSSTVSIDETKRVRWSGKDFNVVFVKNTGNLNHHKLVFLKNDARAQ